MERKSIRAIAREYALGQGTAKKYVEMTREQLLSLDQPSFHQGERTSMIPYANIIYKMLRDEIEPDRILSYVVAKGYQGKWSTLENYIKALARNNFGVRIRGVQGYKTGYAKDVIVLSRNQILTYVTARNPRIRKKLQDINVLPILKAKYPIIEELEQLYDEFYKILMGKGAGDLEDFLKQNETSKIEDFVSGIRRDLEAVKNGISYPESNGFAEGNNNKFKLIKRILYGRAKVTTLFKKSYIAFRVNSKDFELRRLVR